MVYIHSLRASNQGKELLEPTEARNDKHSGKPRGQEDAEHHSQWEGGLDDAIGRGSFEHEACALLNGHVSDCFAELWVFC